MKKKHSRTAFITGGAERIGKAIALHLASDDYNIALHYHTSKIQAENLISEIKKLGVKGKGFCADFSIDEEMLKLFPRVRDVFPDTELMIMNAAVFEKASFLQTDLSLFDRHFSVNLKAPFFLIRDFARQVKKGHVICLLDSSIANNKGGYFSYTLTKKCLADFTKMAARELAPSIRVNAIAPGLLLPRTGEEKIFRILAKKLPMRKRPSIVSLLQVVDFLIANEAITGQVFFIDGGGHLQSG
ncbi:MAG: SDR family oxidoreductase [Candidatus Aureabacteria bacterium]|nr:SDR family oxidoreductase [Candidatus Auribacterota bacterium]